MRQQCNRLFQIGCRLLPSSLSTPDEVHKLQHIQIGGHTFLHEREGLKRPIVIFAAPVVVVSQRELDLLRFVLWDAETLGTYEMIFSELAPTQGPGES